MNNELVSVIVPIYNVEEYLHRAIKSILQQDYPYIELLLVNDGSTDNSLQICKDYALNDDRIKILNQRNQGVSSARNQGLVNATGDWILFLDADDFLLTKDSLSSLFVSEINHYDIVIANIVYVYPDHELIFKQMSPSANTFEEISKGILTDKISPALHAKLYRRFLFNNLFFDATFKIGEDFAMNIQILSKTNRICFIENPIYGYSQRRNSVIHQPSDQAVESLPPFIIFVYDFYSKFHNLQLDKELNQFILSRYYLYFLYGGINTNKQLIEIVEKALNANKKYLPLKRFYSVKIILASRFLSNCMRKPLLMLQSKQL